MTSLQDKIDAIILDFGHVEGTARLSDNINKAIQELREQIKLKQRLHTHPAQLFGYQMALNEVLALIGEKK